MPKDVEEKSSSSNSLVQSIDNNEEDLDEEGCCRCCHCGSGQEVRSDKQICRCRCLLSEIFKKPIILKRFIVL